MAPADNDAPHDDLFSVSSTGGSSTDGSGMEFLDNLAPVGPGAARTATKNSTGRAAAPAAKLAGSAGSAASRGAASRAKAKFDPTIIYIVGGVAAAVVVVAVLFVALSGGSSKSEGKKKDENIRFGMTETQRRHLYEELIHAVDLNGISKETQKEWRSLGRDFKLSDQQIVDVLEEGFAHNDWEQPAMAATMDQKQKTNRMEWIRTRKTNNDPIMAL
jgi:hypothetical protein